MRKLILLLSGCLLCGCASSERMARLSGGVVREYSAPQKHRLRSVEFQKKTGRFSRQQTPERKDFADRTLINIWPFFFRSDDYYSVLWPFFDHDPYGFAIRPLFNKEGDDLSVLFPLSAWNTSAGDGWVTFLYWSRKRLGFFPLFDHCFNEKDGSCYYTPLFIRSWKFNDKPKWNYTLKSDVMTWVLPGYFRRKVNVDMENADHLFFYSGKKYPLYLKQLLAYKLYRTQTPVPQNWNELQEYRKKVFAALPDKEEKYYGVVPLFFAWNKKYDAGFNIAGLLMHYNKMQKKSEFSLLCRLLYSYRRSEYTPQGAIASRENTVIAPLLVYGGNNVFFKETAKYRDFKALEKLAHRSGEPFAKNLPEIKKLYRKLAGEDMPQVICSYPLVQLWLREFAARQKWETEKETYGGFLPLYCFYYGRKNVFHTSPALLTFSDTGRDRSFFLSIPLLTLWSSGKYETLRTTAGPVGYYFKKRQTSRISQPVFDRNTWQVREFQQHRFEDTYALCGLYYHGRDGFSVAKAGLDAKKIENIRKQAWSLKSRYRRYQREQEQIAKRVERNKKWKTDTRLDELKKMVDSEEIRLEKVKADDFRREFEKDLEKWKRDAAGFGMDFDVSSLEEKNFDVCLEKFLEHTTDIRYSEDFGSGIFYRKELAENGDHKWHAFCYLASGSKKGAKEKCQFLHFFYRYSRDGEREEKIIFPFITIRKNKNMKSTSFLWRLWETHETPQGKGGYFLFVPWGKND